MPVQAATQCDQIFLFLDIDGVLLPFGGNGGESSGLSSNCCFICDGCLFPNRNLSALTQILEAFPTISIVLSSTWRVQPKFRQQIIDSFRAYAYLYGGPLLETDLYDITDPGMHTERQHEIYSWLQSRPCIAWIALDDEDLVDGAVNAENRSFFEGHVVKTESHVGLTDGDARTAIALLQKQLAV